MLKPGAIAINIRYKTACYESYTIYGIALAAFEYHLRPIFMGEGTITAHDKI